VRPTAQPLAGKGTPQTARARAVWTAGAGLVQGFLSLLLSHFGESAGFAGHLAPGGYRGAGARPVAGSHLLLI